MKDMKKTAKTLTGFLNVMHVILTVVMVIMLVCLCLIGGYFLFDLDPSMVGSDFDQVDMGYLTITVAEAYIPDMTKVFLTAAGEMVAAIAVAFCCQRLINCFLGILAPMKEGSPFQDAVTVNLKKAAKFTVILGILLNLAQAYEELAKPLLYGLPSLMLSEKITHITIHSEFDLSFLVIAAVMLLLSYVFRYGQELQQLSDETV